MFEQTIDILALEIERDQRLNDSKNIRELRNAIRILRDGEGYLRNGSIIKYEREELK